jgi:hypothetical protein
MKIQNMWVRAVAVLMKNLIALHSYLKKKNLEALIKAPTSK